MGQSSKGAECRDVNGLAVYVRGEGEPMLLMPYSHAFTTTPMAEGPLASMYVRMGRRVVTFDPPGAYRSTRTPTMEIAEMVECAADAISAVGIEGVVDVVGHSAGAFCSAAFAMKYPDRVRGLTLISPTGVGRPSKLRALPFGITDPRFWRFYRLAVPVYGGKGSESQLKAVYDVLVPALHANRESCPAFVVESGADGRPAPPRAALIRGVPKMKSDALAAITAPTLLVVGSHDALVPTQLAEKVAAWIPNAELVVLDGCGHYPQHEMPARLERALSEWATAKSA